MTAAPAMPKSVQTVTVTGDENGMRLDRFFEARFPGLSFSHIQRIIRKGEVRVNGKRAQPKDRLQTGQAVRIPPLKLDAPKPREDASEDQKNRAFIKSITLYEDDDVLVLNKPMGLAVQGGSGTTRHLDGMLGSMREQGRPAARAWCTGSTRTPPAACWSPRRGLPPPRWPRRSARARRARSTGRWSRACPKPQQGRISTFLAKEEREDESLMRIAQARRRGREPRRDLLCRGRDRGAHSSPGSRSSR